MKSAVWVSRGPETTPLRSGYRRVESQRVRSATRSCYPKTIDLYVRESATAILHPTNPDSRGGDDERKTQR